MSTKNPTKSFKRGSLVAGPINPVIKAIFELKTSRSEEVKGATHTQRFRNLIRSCDMFPYDKPVSSVKSFRSGVLSLLTIFAIVYAMVPEFIALSEGAPKINVDDDASAKSFAANPIAVPPLFLTTCSGNGPCAIGRRPYFQNLSFFRIEANLKYIFESDSNPSKPRRKTKMSVRECAVGMKQFGSDSFKPGWCIDNTEKDTIVGKYSSPVYKYIEINVVPCYVYNNSLGIRCAPKLEILNLFHGKNFQTAFALFSKQTESLKGKEAIWESRVYVSLPPERWLGLEVYFKAYRLMTKDHWEALTSDRKFTRFDHYESRTDSMNMNMMLRFYIRMAADSVARTEEVYSVRLLVTRLGSFIVFFYGIAGVIGTNYNRSRVGLYEFFYKRNKKRTEAKTEQLRAEGMWAENPISKVNADLVGSRLSADLVGNNFRK